MKKMLDGLAQVASLFYMIACGMQFLVSHGIPENWNLIGRLLTSML